MQGAGKSYLPGLIFVATIVLVLVAAEITTQIMYKKEPCKPYGISFYTHDGKKITINDDPFKLAVAPYTIYRNLPDQKTDCLTINSQGFRRATEISPVNNNQKRIIVVGGSCAFGHDLGADNETFQSIIEKSNPSFEVINAGVSGFHSGQELTYIITELVDYRPDIIIAFDGWNDLFFPWYTDVFVGRLMEDDELGFNLNSFLNIIERQLSENYQTQSSLYYSFQRFFHTAIDKSALLSLIRMKIARFKQRLAMWQPHETKPEKVWEKDAYFKSILSVYVNNLKKMHDFCSSQKIQFLVVFQPELGQKISINENERTFLKHCFGITTYKDEFPPLYRRFIDGAVEELKAHGVNYIDINAVDKFTHDPKTLFFDVVHTNKNGNEVIAQIINDRLSQMGQ